MVGVVGEHRNNTGEDTRQGKDQSVWTEMGDLACDGEPWSVREDDEE